MLAFLILLPGCTPNHSITQEPTIEEAERPATTITMGNLNTAGQLIRGFHRLEQGEWRWTKAAFAVSLGTPPGARNSGAWVVLKFSLSPILLQHFKSVTLSSALDSSPLAPETYYQPGPQEYRREAPAGLLQNDAVLLEFSLDHFLAAGATEARELGLVVTSLGLEPK